MYALIVFTLGWPAPEPVSTFSRIEVCQATMAVMSHELADISMKCEKVSPLIIERQVALRGTFRKLRLRAGGRTGWLRRA